MNHEAAVEFDQLCQDYMTGLYKGFSGFISYQPGEKESNEKNKVYLTYGEILYPSLSTVIDYLKIDDQDVFYDLGSGIGKVALHFFLKTPVKKACGIEAAEARQNSAQKIYGVVKQEFPELYADGRQLTSQQGNFLETDISDATIIYTCSTCFGEELLKNLGEVFDRCPNLKYVISMKAIPQALPFDCTLEIECTWDKTKCHLYSRTATPVVAA